MSQALIMKSSNTSSKLSPCLRLFIEALFEGSIAGTPSPDLAVPGEKSLVNVRLVNGGSSPSEVRGDL